MILKSTLWWKALKIFCSKIFVIYFPLSILHVAMLTSRGSNIHDIVIVYNISLCHIHLICHIVIIRSMKILRSNLPIHKNVCAWLIGVVFPYLLNWAFGMHDRIVEKINTSRNCQKTMASESGEKLKSMEKAFLC